MAESRARALAKLALNDHLELTAASFASENDEGDSSTAVTIDWTLSNKAKTTLTGAATISFTAPVGPTNLILRLVQDVTGGRTVTWPAAVKWVGGTAPTLATDPSAIDVVTFYYDGTNYYGGAGINYS
jgi:hypothetical protein